MDKKREAINRVMADFLEIPKDLVLDLPRLTLTGRNELYLENHRGIIEYTLTRLRINLSRGFLEIQGHNLEIKYLLPEEISVYGEIEAIKFLD
ncbi:MAG TPA: sporulation protein YqfC [Syntrophomonadaceae bacterium]|nr:sporulation protein YqfC [Syntrophomonadaceae bacterium]HNX29218.1 sporulation protein YqfC [Syntrophomonadaceae bacterium]HPR92586.1 sporulation protein YqfC [Syntrophomonadaceae bacterium]